MRIISLRIAITKLKEIESLKKRVTEIIHVKSGVIEGSDGDNYVLYSGIDWTWYGMNINVSHEDIKNFQLCSYGLLWFLSKYKIGVPNVDAWLYCAKGVILFSGLLSNNYDNGNGFSIVCSLYVPSYAISY